MICFLCSTSMLSHCGEIKMNIFGGLKQVFHQQQLGFLYIHCCFDIQVKDRVTAAVTRAIERNTASNVSSVVQTAGPSRQQQQTSSKEQKMAR